jgi:hypothetical protein
VSTPHTATGRPGRRRLPPPHRLHLLLGQREQALAWLEAAAAAREGDVLLLGVDPEFDVLRDEPRLADLLRRTGVGLSAATG